MQALYDCSVGSEPDTAASVGTGAGAGAGVGALVADFTVGNKQTINNRNNINLKATHYIPFLLFVILSCE
jgi:hypothetical protein